MHKTSTNSKLAEVLFITFSFSILIFIFLLIISCFMPVLLPTVVFPKEVLPTEVTTVASLLKLVKVYITYGTVHHISSK